jgi:hypothetical protein
MSDFIVVPSELTSVLSAVNLLINSIGETSVSTIDPPPTTDVEDALYALDRADKVVQLMGWTWNKEIAFQTSLDVQGRVVLADQTLMITGAYFTPTGYLNVVQRGAYLYDRANHTYTFQTAPLVDYTARLAWEYLPEAARTYIMYLAAQEFHAQKQERVITLQVTEKRLARALIALEQYEDQVGKFNTVTGNVGVQLGLGWNRNRSGIS